jgi:hypothetical protein
MYLDHLHGVNEFVHKVSADTNKFVFSCAVLVHNMLKLCFYRFLHWFISEGHQVYILVAVWCNIKNAEILHTTEHSYITL